MARFLAAFGRTPHTVLTDNGAEFTDRFGGDVAGAPADPAAGMPSTASAPPMASSTA